jgi:glyoxylase-like metal-dependent hydrolase (beta-lactamase superfamily II)
MADKITRNDANREQPVSAAGDPFPRLLADGLWVLGNPYVNLYLVKGGQASALVEAGVSAGTDEVVRQLESLEVRPSFLIVTHPHADHVTGLDGLREAFPETLVTAAEGAAEFLLHPATARAIVAEDRHMSGFLASQGFEPGRPPIEEPPSLADCLIAKEGDEMDLGGSTLRFLAVKGHSPGCVNVRIPELDALIVSDSLGFRFEKRGFTPIFFTGYSDYMETLERLERLTPRILGPAHQGPLVGRDVVDRAFAQARDAALELRRRILAGPKSDEELVAELFEESYREEFLLYSEENIRLCCELLVKRAKESDDGAER